MEPTHDSHSVESSVGDPRAHCAERYPPRLNRMGRVLSRRAKRKQSPAGSKRISPPAR